MCTILTKAVNNVDCHALNLFRNVASLFENIYKADNLFSDISMRIGNKRFYCHRLILQLNSEYFASIFLAQEMELNIINPEQFYEVLQFIYTGEVIVSTNNIESLLSAALKLRVPELTHVCFRFLEDAINKTDTNMLSHTTHSKLAHLYKSQVTQFCSKFKLSELQLLSVSEFFIREILSDDDLQVDSEEVVCDTLMKWLQVQTKTGKEVHPDKLLPLIRWSGISVDYVNTKLFPDKMLMSDPATILFLSKLTMYLMSGIQFEGLQTFHRAFTGSENCLVLMGMSDGYTHSREVYKINLQSNSDNVSQLSTAPKKLDFGGSISCVSNNNVYITGAGNHINNQTWAWTTSSGWNRHEDMLTKRYHHCATVVNSKLYLLGGERSVDDSDEDDKTTSLNTVDSYNINKRIWSSVGHLMHAVSRAACATYNDSIYVFGGLDNNNDPMNYVQVYDTLQNLCTLLDKSMPSAQSRMRAVLWETSVVLLGKRTCFVYNFQTNAWMERKQYKTDVMYFGITLDNERVYIAGGGASKMKLDQSISVTCTDKIRSVPVLDIIEDKPAAWKNHGRLPEPTMIFNYGGISIKVE